MAYMITHFYEGGTEDQYRAVVDKAHPANGLPDGQRYHFAGPTEGGWLVVAVWDTKADFDTFVAETLMPVLQTTPDAFTARPQMRGSEIANTVTG